MKGHFFSAPRFRNSRAGFAALQADLPDQQAGLVLGPTGAIEMVSGRQSVEQALALLLSTRPGERVMRPEYGCDLHRLLFAPNDDTTAGLAAHYVSKAVHTWEPRVQLLDVDATRDAEDSEQLIVTVSYRLRSTGHRGNMTYPFRLA